MIMEDAGIIKGEIKMRLLGRPFNNEKCTQKQEEIRLEEERARAEKEITLEIQTMELEYNEFILGDEFCSIGPDDEEVLDCEVDNDYIFLILGYENVGYSGLYEEFYYEKKFNYETMKIF